MVRTERPHPTVSGHVLTRYKLAYTDPLGSGETLLKQ